MGKFVGEGDNALGAQADLGIFENLLSICFFTWFLWNWLLSEEF